MSFRNWTPFFNKPGPLVSHAGSSRLPQRPLRLLALLRSRQREFLVSLPSPKRAPQHSANNFTSDYNTQVLTLGTFSMYFFHGNCKMETGKSKKYWLRDNEDFRHDAQQSDRIIHLCTAQMSRPWRSGVVSRESQHTRSRRVVGGHRHVQSRFTQRDYLQASPDYWGRQLDYSSPRRFSCT